MAKQYYIRKTDDQTIDPTSVPATNTGTVLQMLGRLANRIKAITGKTNWYDWPTVTLEDAATHYGRTDNPHSATAAQTGALVSVDGVSNAGGNVDFVASTNMTITPNDSGNTVTFASSGGGATNLDGLSDVTIASPSTGQVVKYNGTTWVNDTDAAGGGSAATETVAGIAELATQTETDTGTDDARIVTPLKLATRTATETRTGVVELATDGETQTGTDTARAITPANLSARSATETRTGVAELATQAEADAGTDDARIMTPLKSANMLRVSPTEVSVTGATTLTSTAFGKMHVCSGTSANYTVGLPAVSGNGSKVIGFRGAAALTKIVTLDPNSTELVDGLTVIVLKPNEEIILHCTGSEWQTVAPSRRTPKILLDYRSATDINNGTTLTANTQINFGPSHSFTVESPNSRVEIIVGGNALVGTAASICAASIVVDGGSNTLIGGGYPGSGVYANPLAGAQPVFLSGLAVGAHTLQVQVVSPIASSLYCRSATNPATERLYVQVIEHG